MYYHSEIARVNAELVRPVLPADMTTQKDEAYELRFSEPVTRASLEAAGAIRVVREDTREEVPFALRALDEIVAHLKRDEEAREHK